MTTPNQHNNYPKISIITPSLNQGDYIEETIQSVLGQGYPNLEYIVMDGGSTDQTLDILRKYTDQINWISEKDQGQSHAINKGLQLATGEVIAYLNSDDVYMRGALHKVGAFFAKYPQAQWLTGRCKIINSKGVEIRKLITAYKNFWLCVRSQSSLLIIDYISQPATFWRRQLVHQVGLLNEDLHLAMDYDYSLRIARHHKLWVINDYLASFRVHSNSKSTLIREHFSEDLAVAQKYTRSGFILNLHRLHNQLIVFSYLMNNK